MQAPGSRDFPEIAGERLPVAYTTEDLFEWFEIKENKQDDSLTVQAPGSPDCPVEQFNPWKTSQCLHNWGVSTHNCLDHGGVVMVISLNFKSLKHL
jgi:hypothetical protein